MSNVDQRKCNMARKKIAPKAAKAKRPKANKLSRETVQSEKHHVDHMAIVSLAPVYNAGALVATFADNVFGKVDALQAAEELRRRCDHLRDGKTGRMEDMLLAQAHSLEVMFVSLARRAKAQDLLPQYEAHMKLALRAQNQCRMTLETLATIKNPPVVFAKQANIAHGHQQVNNGETTPVARTSETSNRPNKLLEGPRAIPEWMDTGASRAATPGDPGMATVEAIDGPEDDAG